MFGHKESTAVPATAISATVAPTVVVTPLVIPKEADTAFEGEMSAAEVEKLLQEQIAEVGDYVSDIHVQITPEAILAQLQVNASELKITFGVTATALPNVVDGQLYLKIIQVTLDDTLSGWTRLSAKSLIQEAIDKYSGENGIPIEFDNIYIEEVKLGMGKLYVRGKTL
ncbi:MAG: hypothetical protein LLG44_10245 [Chloroflexi bacterium]|nr:hypothetical protein [Chloroflexota bacterium]